MRRPIRVEASRGLLELALAAGSVAPSGMKPGDGDVYEPLQEVALGSGRVAPIVLELLVRLEVLTRSDQLQPSREPHLAIICGTEC